MAFKDVEIQVYGKDSIPYFAQFNNRKLLQNTEFGKFVLTEKYFVVPFKSPKNLKVSE